MRSRDLHILTSDKFTFSSDERFKPQHLSGSDAWTLQLDRVRKSDAGRYECQVNTEPKIMYAVQLVVRGTVYLRIGIFLSSWLVIFRPPQVSCYRSSKMRSSGTNLNFYICHAIVKEGALLYCKTEKLYKVRDTRV